MPRFFSRSWEFWDGTLQHPITYDADGSKVREGVWTGFTATGSTRSDRCDDWTKDGSSLADGSGGFSDTTSNDWAYNGNDPQYCYWEWSLYCIQD